MKLTTCDQSELENTARCNIAIDGLVNRSADVLLIRNVAVANGVIPTGLATLTAVLGERFRRIAQGPGGELEHEIQAGSSGASATWYPTSLSAFEFHTDGSHLRTDDTPEMVLLSCIAEPEAGGSLYFASVRAVINYLTLNGRDDVLQSAAQPFPFALGVPTLAPVSHPILDAKLSRIRFSPGRIAEGEKCLNCDLRDSDWRAVRWISRAAAEVCTGPVELRQGDAVLMNNRRVLHARDAYVNSADHCRVIRRVWYAR